jgi:predicted AAA+ superfamily ATPase
LGGLAIENLIAVAGEEAEPSFYRTGGGAEVDLVLTWPDGREWAIEVKRSLAPKVEWGLHSALEDLRPHRSFVVYPGSERYPLSAGVETIGLAELCAEAAAV